MKFGEYEGSFQVAPLAIMIDEDLTLPQKTILSFIWSMCAYKENKKAIVTSSVLEKITSLDRSNVHRNTKVLIDLGYIKKELIKTQYSSQKLTEYTLNIDLLCKKYNLEYHNKQVNKTVIKRAPITRALLPTTNNKNI